MQVQFLGFENSLEDGTATNFNILDWRISWTEESGGLESTGSQKVGPDWSDLAQNTQDKGITEADVIKKLWHEYKELYKEVLMTWITTMVWSMT